MVQNMKRAGGRPRSFDADAALDRAVEVFWRCGYDGASLDELTAAMGIGRPSLYAAFGDKQHLFAAALKRYGETVGAMAVEAFLEASQVRDAVAAFFRVAACNQARDGGPTGCLLACTAASVAETQPEVRMFYATGLQAMENMLKERLERAVADGELRHGFPTGQRARLMVDLMQGLALRARSGSTREELRSAATAYADLVLDA